jgi:predicted nucleic acid-binding protein
VPPLYFDTSALVKYYHREAGSRWVEKAIGARQVTRTQTLNPVYLAEISIVETAAALAQLTRTGRITEAVRNILFGQFLTDVIERFQTIHVTRELVNSATALTQSHPLRGYDAVQLAVGVKLDKALKADDIALVFVTSDQQLLSAAQEEGLETANPQD